MEDILFYVFAVLVVASAAIVVFSKNIMYSAFSLLFTFFGLAGLYVLLYADFIALTQIMIYIGGILVLIIFGIMLTSRITGVDIKTGTVGKLHIAISAVVSSAVLIILIVLYKNVNWVVREHTEPVTTIKDLGNSLITEYFLAFEVSAVLLLVALVGAALIARRK